MRSLALCLSLLMTASAVCAQETLGLSAPAAVSESGLLKFILPRFSLKSGIRVAADPEGEMTLAETPPGTAVFEGAGVLYHLRIADDARQEKFRDWLLSDVGKRTIDSFQIDGVAPFSSDVAVQVVEAAPVFAGNAGQGAKLALVHCGRCHVIGPENAKNGIGSTPSFAVLRALNDWDDRFQQFFVRAPHGAFTQIEDVTDPFDPERPSPIFPLELTLDDLDAILAFVAVIQPADLGAPLQFQ